MSTKNFKKDLNSSTTNEKFHFRHYSHSRIVGALFFIGICSIFARPLNSSNPDSYFRLVLLNLFFYLIISSLIIPVLLHQRTNKIYIYLFALITLLLTFPYGLLRMSDNFYYQNRASYHVIPMSEPLILAKYFLSNVLPSQFPGKIVVFAIFACVAVASLIAIKKWSHWELHLIWVITLVTTWRSTSYASPISWSSSRELPVESHRVYLRSHWENGAGAVSADQPVWSELTNLFQFGVIENTSVIRRPFTNYLVANLSFFSNSYPVWIFVNLSLWTLAAYCCMYVINYLGYSRGAQLSGGLIIATAPVFKTFVGQSSAYMSSFAATWILSAIVLYLMKTLPNKTSLFLSLTAAFGLAFLTWDLYLWIPVYLALFMKIGVFNFQRGISILFCSFTIFLFYRFVLIPFLGIKVASENESILLDTIGLAGTNLLNANFKYLDEMIRKSAMDFTAVTYIVVSPFVLALLIVTILLGKETLKVRSFSKFYLIAFLYPLLLVFFFSIAGNSTENTLPYRFSLLLLPIVLLTAQMIDQIPRKYRFAYFMIFSVIFALMFLVQISNLEVFHWIYHNINMGIYRPMVW